MREIDDRYPEFARPWEPVKGGKHYKKLRFAALPLTAAVLAVIGLTVELPKPEIVPEVSAPTENVELVPVTEPPAPVIVPVTLPPAEPVPKNDPDNTPKKNNRYDPRGYPEPKPPVTIPPVTYPPVTVPPVTVPPVTVPPVTYPPVTYPPVTDPPVTVPPVTDPPVTVPPVTDPPVTVPPVTDPPVTVPPVTDPPVTREEPITEVNRHVEYEEMDAGTIFYSVELKDLKGGSAKATLHRKTGSGWEALSGPGASAERSFAEDDEYWTVNDYGSEDLLYHMPSLHDDIGAAETVKVVFDFTYPDGTTGTYESDPLPIHNGTYAMPNYYYAREGWDYIWTTNDLIFDVLIRNDLVDESRVEATYTEVYDEDAGVRVEATPAITRVQDDSGDWHMIFTYHFEEMLHEGNFSFYTALHYPEDAYNSWDVDVDMSFAL